MAEPDTFIVHRCVQQYPQVSPACNVTRAMAKENSLEGEEHSSSCDSGCLGEISDSVSTLDESVSPKSSPSVRPARPDEHIESHQGVREKRMLSEGPAVTAVICRYYLFTCALHEWILVSAGNVGCYSCSYSHTVLLLCWLRLAFHSLSFWRLTRVIRGLELSFFS